MLKDTNKQAIQQALILLGLFILTACQNGKKPDLELLYLNHATDQSNTPLIIIHGTMGSKLRDKTTSEELWIGNLKKLAFSKYKNLALEIDPISLENSPSNIEAYQILDSISGMKIYEDLIHMLDEYGGYQLNESADTSTAGRNLYVFNYDWRQDNVKSAQQLSHFISRVRQSNDNKPVDIVAHSMGGLITRYFLRYGATDVIDDAVFTPNPQQHQTRHVIFLGTPNLGSVLSINRFINGFDFNLRTIPIEVLITMPSVYQLLPFEQNPWLYNTQGEAIELDVFNPQTWKNNAWAIYDPNVQAEISKETPEKLNTYIDFFDKQLKRAQHFWWAISHKQNQTDLPFVAFGGDCKLTANNLVIEDIEGSQIIHAKPNQIKHPIPEVDYHQLMLAPGDGQVTKDSLLGRTKNSNIEVAVKYPIFLCEDHLKLTNNLNFQDNLLHILLQ